MRADIQGRHLALQDVFGKGFVFHIPGYQRPYRWGIEECEELFNDLHGAIPSGEIKDARPYFLGSIVLVKEDLSTRSEVIDGQQRLTTLTILLSVLQAATDEETRNSLKEYLRQDRNVVTGAPAQFRLHLRERDGAFFQKFVQEEDGLERLAELGPQEVEVHERIRKNALRLKELLSSLPMPDRLRLAQFIMQRCYLVVVSTAEPESAFRIFNVLNSRGLDLSAADIIKSKVLSQIDSDRREACTVRWEETESRLGNENFEALLMHLCVMAQRRRLAGALETEFVTSVANSLGPEKTVDFIALNGSLFEQLERQQLLVTESNRNLDDRARRALRWLKEVDHANWVPVALSMCRRIKSPLELVTQIEALERLVAFHFVSRATVNTRVARYGRVLEWLSQRSSGESPLSLTVEERERFRDCLDGEVYPVVKTRQYILRRVDEAIGDGGARYDLLTPTVEHVLPQNPKYGSRWFDWFTAEQAEHWRNRLANLVLLTRAKNSEASNYEFEEKKKKYFESPHGVSTYALTTQVLREKEWTPAHLAKRQKDLLGHLIREWKLGEAG